MRTLFKQLFRLLLLIVIVALLLTAGRVVFYFANSDSFDLFTGSELFYAVLKGVEYDFLTVIIVNVLFIFLFLWPAKVYNSIFYLSLLKILFFTVNGVVILLNLFDIRFFKLHGHRLRAFEFTKEMQLFFNELQAGRLNDLVSRYLSLSIYFFVFLVFIWLSLRLIKKRSVEQNKEFVFHKWSSIVLLIGIISWVIFNNIERTYWLTKLYLKTDRRLTSLVVNNPYLLVSSLRSEDIKTISDWNIEEYSSNKTYTSLKLQNYEDIKLVIIEKKKLPDAVIEDSYTTLGSLNYSSSGIFQLLDEVFLSFPGIYKNGFYQSVYSLNKYENLVDILRKAGYTIKLSIAGYDKKVGKLIRNFYGFSNSSKLNEVEAGKNFEFILINAKDNENNFLLANTKILDTNSLIIRMEVGSELEIKDENKLSQSISFTSLESLPFYCSVDSIITQPLDIKPSILHLIGYNKTFTSYGSSLFAAEDKVIFQSISDSSQRIIKDSLLLTFSNNETTELRKLNKSRFSEFDFKDSLAVERIILENKRYSILRDYQQKLMKDSL